ncbi:MAG: serine/threonine protein kinase [Planctomycetes bacterium]|nr:serine/threonine protein kinase [Planctomycetota bacterium]
MVQPPHDDLEALLADALAALDDGGEAALQQFLTAHQAQRPALERALGRARQMGLVEAGPTRDFPDRLGEFRLLRRIGSGGMGVVYEAEQESLGRRVALKVVRPELLYFEGARERFRREIEAVARLSHPAIVPVLASGEQDGLPFYAMELLGGLSANELCHELRGRDPTTLEAKDLRRVLRTEPGADPGSGTDPLTGAWWQVATRIVQQVALGVRHAHLRGIVHRDIKPGNVMLTPEGRTVLLDFGIAQIAGGREFTRTGSNPGSPAFMSPEQLRGDAVDERTDIYSLGATLWQLLTLEPPFAGVDDLQRIQLGDVADVRSKNRDVPPELALVVATAMDVDRERRYPDVGAFADDLAAVLQRRPIRARRLGPVLRTMRWCQRHRVAATALAMLLFGTLLLPVVVAWRERAVNLELASTAAARERSLDLALLAIRELLVRVADDHLRHVPSAERVAREALREAVAHYRALLREYPDHTALRRDAGRALTRFADLLARNGDPDAARQHLREAISTLGDDGPDETAAVLVARAVASMHYGSLLQTHGQAALARAHFDAADRDLALAGERSGDDPTQRHDVLRTRVEVVSQRTHGLDRGTQAQAIEGGYREGLQRAREVVAMAPDNLFDRQQLVQQLDTLATHLGKLQRYDEAKPLLDEALQLAESIPVDAPFWPPQKMLLAAVLETMGNQQLEQRDQQCYRPLQRCLELREEVAHLAPDDALVLSFVGAALHNLARMNFRQAQDQRALERLDRAIDAQRRVLGMMPTLEQGRDYLRNHLILRVRVLKALGDRAQLEATTTELGAMPDAIAQRGAARGWLELLSMSDVDVATATQHAIDRLLEAERLGWGTGDLEGRLYTPLHGDERFEAMRQRRREAETARQQATQRVSPPSTSNASREMPR